MEGSEKSQSQETMTEVVILGGRYNVKSGYSPSFVERTAKLVNERMSEIIRDGGVIPTDKVAILACMNIASELLKLQEDNQTTKDRMRKKLEKVLAVIDTCLAQEDLSYVTKQDESSQRHDKKEEDNNELFPLHCA